MKAEILAGSDQLVSATLTSVYQGLLVVLLVALGLQAFRRTNAATRHGVWLATLVLVVALLPAHLLMGWFGNGENSKSEIRNSKETRPEEIRRPQDAAGEPQFSPAMQASLSRPVLVAPQPDLNLSYGPEAHANDGPASESAASAPTAADILTAEQIRPPKRVLGPLSWNLGSPRLPRTASLVLLGAWVAVAGVRLLLLFWRLGQLRKLKIRSVPAGEDLNRLFERLCEQLQLKRRAELRLSTAHPSAALLGFFRPMILLPAQAADPGEREELVPILRHELAHLRRRDDWANLFQQFIQATLFFHPAVWWICRQLTIAREIACDDYVLHQGSGPRAYALLLATLAGRMQATRALPAPGVSTSKTQLQQRIDMILSTHRNTSPRLAKTRLGLITSAAAAIAALAIYSAPRIVLAQAAPAPAPPEAPATPELPPSAAVNASDLVPAQPPAGLSFSHNAPSPAPLPPDVEPDPKPKARNAPAPPAMAQPRWPAEVQVFPPAPPAHPEFPPGHPPYIVGGQPPVKVPRTPEPPSADASVEERLQRLEKMLQSLLTEQDKKSSALNFYYQHPPSKDLAKQKELVERQAAAAAEEANRAVRELEKQLKLQDERRSAEISQDGFKHRMEALRQARQALERQMQSLDRQIAELERDRARLERNEQRKDQLRLQEREMEKEKQRQRDKHNEDEPGSHDGTTGIIDGSRQWVGLAGTSVAIDAARQWILTTGPAK